MKNYLFVILFCTIATTLSAQQKKDSLQTKLKFVTVTQVGLLAGNSGSSAGLQLINGIAYKKLYAGIGAGLDYYLYRGFPVFADFRYHLTQKRNTLFLYADGGIHFPWQKKEVNNSVQPKLKNGLYTDIGFGYKLIQKNGNALVMSFGYTRKKVSEERKEFTLLPGVWDINIPEQTIKYQYGLNRIAIKFGLMF